MMDAMRRRQLLREMLRIRLVEETIAAQYPQQEMRCPTHLCIGQEAVAVGVCAALAPTDYVMSGHRCHGHYLAKGGDLKAMLAEIYGKATGCSGGKGGSMHLVDLTVGFLGATPIVGATVPVAVGAAWGSMMLGDPRVAAVFFGDAVPETGVFHEAVNFAVLKRAPVLFVCENNGYSVYSPLDVRQPPGRSLVQLAAGHGLPSAQGDGNNVLDVLALAEQAVERARAGGGPTFLEFSTYRWREHCGPYDDTALGYRSAQEVARWTERCPVARFQRSLIEQGSLRQQDVEEMTRELTEELEAAFAFARESPFPGEARLLEDVYAPSRNG